MKHLLLLIAMLHMAGILTAQIDIQTSPFVKFDKDSAVALELHMATSDFLESCRLGQIDYDYANEDYKKKNGLLLAFLRNYGRSGYYNDSLFYEPHLMAAVASEEGYLLTLALIGQTEDSQPILNMVFNLRALQGHDDSYSFHSIPKLELKADTFDDVTYRYQKTLNKAKVKRLLQFRDKLTTLTEVGSPLQEYYVFDNVEAMMDYAGVDYYSPFSQTPFDREVGMHNHHGQFFTAVGEDYLHDYLHFHFAHAYSYTQTWREVEEGFAVYYSDNWGVELDELVPILREQMSGENAISILDEVSGEREATYVGKQKITRIAHALIVKDIIENYGFDDATNLLYCGDNGEDYFNMLRSITDIGRKNFEAYVWELTEEYP